MDTRKKLGLVWTKPPDAATFPVEDPWHKNGLDEPGEGGKVRMGHVNVSKHVE